MSSGKLRELRGRIRSIIAIQQTTRAMRMIAAVKLRKAQDRLQRLRPFRDHSKTLLHLLLTQTDEIHPYQLASPTSPSLFVILSSSRGLCGAFNSTLIRWLLPQLPAPSTVELLILGKKAYEALRRTPYKIDYQDLLGGRNIDEEAVKSVAASIFERFRIGQVREVVLIYNRFGGVGKFIPTSEQLLPLPQPAERESRPWLTEPSLDELIERFTPEYVEIALLAAMQESVTAEHAARMVAMQAATDNAEELLQNLRLQYNKARQASITKELLEIVAGAEALKG
ncbi:MAG: ATP synthase F1 subunit gamma [Bacteroidia bacterium]|nr:ATP synthase F1 subunit gamma [Bacteroidia bacterium]MDW8015028.1 ATP synthase F1 subunit gamma [Bacteroidia bacterium]